MTLFDFPPVPYEPPPGRESADARRTRLNNLALSQGRHPATNMPLLDPAWGFTCGSCAHAHVRRGAKTWWKCALHRLGMSSSAASDIRKSWPACTSYRIDAG